MDIEVADNSENGYTSYGAAHWDGEKWELKKLSFIDKDYQGNNITVLLWDIKGIIAFNSTDIWLALGDIFHWNGIDSLAELSYQIVTPTGLLPGINKLWGNSSNNIYGVGNSGSIVHSSKAGWQKIESGTDVDINDVWGVVDPQTNQQQVFCAVSKEKNHCLYIIQTELEVMD